MVNGHGNAAPAPQPLLLPNGHMLHQIAPLTPEQLAELAQNTQLKNQLYAQLLYRSMAQTAPGQPPMQLQQLLNLSQPLLLAQPGQQQPIIMAPPGVPPGDLVQNLLMMPMRQAPQPAPATAKPDSALQPQPAASAQPSASYAIQSHANPALSLPAAGTSLQPMIASARPGQEASMKPATTGGSMTTPGQQPGVCIGGLVEAVAEGADKVRCHPQTSGFRQEVLYAFDKDVNLARADLLLQAPLVEIHLCRGCQRRCKTVSTWVYRHDR